MRTTDNNGGKDLDKILEASDKIEDLQHIANTKIKDIKLEKYPNLLVFPRDLKTYYDDIGESEIFKLSDTTLTTGNIMGFIGLNTTNLTITSRFAKNDAKDFFLHYMHQKVLSLNLFDLRSSSGKNDIWDFLIFLFPYFFNKALSQGLYKEYKRNEFNDANVRGVIDVKRHLRINIPFAGKVAYSAREYSHDNPVLHLVRHTIEFIEDHKFGNAVLTSNADLHLNINQITNATPAYNRNNRQKIIAINKKKPVVHPYFTEYKALQRLCLRILNNEKISTGSEEEKIHGILFDGAWLWEEYLNTLLKDKGFKHPQNKKREGGYRLFNTGGRIYPDFIKETNPPVIADAKYKRLNSGNENDEDSNTNGRRRDNSDYYQLMAYMYRFDSQTGYLLYPCSEEAKRVEKKILKGFRNDSSPGAGRIVELGLNIPPWEQVDNYAGFQNAMKESESQFQKEVEV